MWFGDSVPAMITHSAAVQPIFELAGGGGGGCRLGGGGGGVR